MSRAEELANALDMHWIESFRCHPNDSPMCESAAAELRRLAQVEAEHAALKKAISDAVPVAHLWQHGETGRTRIVMPDQIVTADANWSVVGPLYTLNGIKK